jgi:hypothetical protein
VPVTLERLIEVVEKAKAEAKPEDLKKPVRLNLGNARSVYEASRGEGSYEPKIEVFTLSVLGEPSLLIFAW